MTQKQIDDAIKTCIWRKEMCGVDVCTGNVLPCIRSIENGTCDALIKLFEKEGAYGDTAQH